MNQIPQIHHNSKNSIERDGHVLVVSYPLQGHVAPLIKLSHKIAEHGTKVTFVITEFIRARMAETMPDSNNENHHVRLVSVPDGLEPEDDRKDQRKLAESINKVMPGHLEELLKNPKQSINRETISGIIIDSPLAWMLEIPKKMGLKTAIYWCSTPGCLVLGLNIEKLIENKLLDKDGTPLKHDKLQLLPNMPAMSTTEFTWYFPGDSNMQKGMFQAIQGIMLSMKKSDWIICNWFDDLEPSPRNLMPNILPVGPLLANGQSAGSFCSEDSSCLSWLDKQAPGSVVYVAFGSTSRFSQHQLDELAMGLELMDRPFLWVAWSGLTNGSFPTYPDGFTERIGGRGKIVDWAPQEMVLAHPSIACFLSHCGWGSTMESISMGVPFLCWPYFGDQLYTQTCICDAWKIGLWLTPNENGIISRIEIKRRMDELLSDATIRANATKLKDMARKSIQEGGSSSESLQYLIAQITH